MKANSIFLVNWYSLPVGWSTKFHKAIFIVYEEEFY